MGCWGLKTIPDLYFLQVFSIPSAFWFPQIQLKRKISQSPCCFNEGIVCQSQLSRSPLDSQSTAGFEGSCTALLPCQHHADPRSGIQAPQADKCIKGICPGLACVFQDAVDVCSLLEWQLEAGGEDPGKPGKVADSAFGVNLRCSGEQERD